MLKGEHLIAGQWVAGETTFTAPVLTGPAKHFAVGTPALAAAAAEAAAEAFESYGVTTREARAGFLETIAEEIEARGAEITETAQIETGLPAARLEGERGRTTGQLRLFASHIRKGDYLDLRHDTALPDRKPLPRPDLRLVQLPVGPVAVFGASNFPLAFSTGGGDTASALAAGCPVVVKGHEAHPGAGELVAQAIAAAVERHGLHPGTFSFVQGGSREVGQALVEHPAIRAAGFTGSLAGGRALFDLCAARPEPIPFFGELGSINPIFLLPAALKARGAEIGQAWVGSLTLGAGQFCTNPGLLIAMDGDDLGAFRSAALSALDQAVEQSMLTRGIAEAFGRGCERLRSAPGVETRFLSPGGSRSAVAAFFETDGETWLKTPTLAEEVFGPAGLLVRVASFEQMLEVAQALEGQLTATLQVDPADTNEARALVPVLQNKAGRILANGFPTGVEVADAMVHGGPYPASTNFGATSVGTLAIRRWLRPVCFQSMPEDLLPEALNDQAGLAAE